MTNHLALIKQLFITAEFIIHLSETNNTLDSFKKALAENGAEFSESFVSNLLRIIQHMRPKKSSAGQSNTLIDSTGSKEDLAFKFPGLAIPNEPQIPLSEDEDDKQDSSKVVAEEKVVNEDNDVVADLMAQFEADAPSANKNKEILEDKKRKRFVV